MMDIDFNNIAALTGKMVRDFDGETGALTGDIDTDGETVIVRIAGENFSRWSDALDLNLVSGE